MKIFETVHELACFQKKDFYEDPETGFRVFTAYFLRERGYCCESGCRHCPYSNNKPRCERSSH